MVKIYCLLTSVKNRELYSATQDRILGHSLVQFGYMSQVFQLDQILASIKLASGGCWVVGLYAGRQLTC